MDKKGGLWQDYMGYILIAIALFVIVLLGYLSIQGKLSGIVEYLQQKLSFRI